MMTTEAHHRLQELQPLVRNMDDNPAWGQFANKLAHAYVEADTMQLQQATGAIKAKSSRQHNTDCEVFLRLADVATDWPGCPLGQTRYAVQTNLTNFTPERARR